MATTTARSDALVLTDLAAVVLIALVTEGCRQPEPAPTIYHLANTHYVSREDFAADLHDLDDTLADAEIDRRYESFLDDLERLQNVQARDLRRLNRDSAAGPCSSKASPRRIRRGSTSGLPNCGKRTSTNSSAD